jgi:hypothetical protein
MSDEAFPFKRVSKPSAPAPGEPVRQKPGFAIHHLMGAAYFSRQLDRLEKEGPPKNQEEWIERIAFASSGIMAAAAFLECSINELFDAAVDESEDIFGSDRKTMQELAGVWDDKLERAQPLEKFARALAVLGKPPFDLSANPYQSAADLFSFRNALVHYRPEWTEPSGDKTKLARRLAGKFPENMALPLGFPAFPHRYLSHGSAAWSVRTAAGFITTFASMVRLPLYLKDYPLRTEA